MDVGFDVSKREPRQQTTNLAGLRHPAEQQQFISTFKGGMDCIANNPNLSLDGLNDTISQSLLASSETVGKARPTPRKHWISAWTMGLIEHRNMARNACDSCEESAINI